MVPALLVESVESVQPEAFAGARAASTPRPLHSTGLGNWGHKQRLRVRPWIVELLFDKPWIHHVHNSINRYRCFCDIGGHNNLARALWGRWEHLSLLLHGQAGIKRQHHHWLLFTIGTILYLVARILNLLLTAKEQQDISFSLFTGLPLSSPVIQRWRFGLEILLLGRNEQQLRDEL